MNDILEQEMALVLEGELMRLASADPKVARVMVSALQEVILRLKRDGFCLPVAMAGITNYVGFCRDLAILGAIDELPMDANSFYEGACAFVEDLIGGGDICEQAA